GSHLPSAESRQRSSQYQVAWTMRTPGESLAGEFTVTDALDRIRTSASKTCLVTNATGVIGVISLPILEKLHWESSDKTLADVLDPMSFPHVHADHGLDLALERMGTNRLDLLPVVNRGNLHKLEGIITLQDVLVAYGI